jgi:hypothetical protein
MAKLVGGAGWVVVGGATPPWRWVSFIPTKPSTPISRTARTTPITVRRPRGLRRNRLDEEALPLTFTRLCRNVTPGWRLPQESRHGKFGQPNQHIEDGHERPE